MNIVHLGLVVVGCMMIVSFYAAGYGRVPIVVALLDAGANPALLNNAGKSVADVTRMNPGNKVLDDPELVARLEPSR